MNPQHTGTPPISLSPISASRRSLIRSLARRKKRREQGLFLAEGLRLLGELAGTPDMVEFLYVTPEMAGSIPSELCSCRTYLIDPDEKGLFTTDNPQGVGAVVRMLPRLEPDRLNDYAVPFLLLDGISDPGNAGTILRGADWFGLEVLLFGEGSVDPWNPKTVRASMGGIFRVKIAEGVRAADLRELGRPIYLLDIDGELTLGTAPLDPKGIYVIGNEAHGLSAEWRSVGRTLSIPGRGGGESLNAAMAATILCWELLRPDQRPG